MTYVAITMLAGDSLMLDFIVADPDGHPINLSVAAVKWGTKPRGSLKTACAPILTKETGVDDDNNSLGITILGNDMNIARVALLKGDVQAGAYMHELEVTLASGDSFTAASGPLDATATVFPN